MVLSIIIGTVVWLIIIAKLSEHMEIFGTPWAWFISWFVVVAIVSNIGDLISDSKADQSMIKEAKRIDGTWESSDDTIGLRALTDDGDVTKYDDNSFIVAIYKKDDSRGLMLVYPEDNTVRVVFSLSDIDDMDQAEKGEYKLKGLFSKKLVLDMENSGKIKYKRKSKDWEDYE